MKTKRRRVEISIASHTSRIEAVGLSGTIRLLLEEGQSPMEALFACCKKKRIWVVGGEDGGMLGWMHDEDEAHKLVTFASGLPSTQGGSGGSIIEEAYVWIPRHAWPELWEGSR